MKRLLPLLLFALLPLVSFSQQKLPVGTPEPVSPVPTHILQQKIAPGNQALIQEFRPGPTLPVFQQAYLQESTKVLNNSDSPPKITSTATPSTDLIKFNAQNMLPSMKMDMANTAGMSAIACDDAPIGTDDNYLTSSDKTLTVAAPGFLFNDIDLQGEALTATVILDNVDNGSLTAFPDGNFSYTPDAGFVGTDQFIYQMRDASNNLSVPVTVTIVVTDKSNRNPIGANDEFTSLANTTLSIAAPGFLANDIDLDGEAITAISILDNVDNGSLTAFPSGNFTYTPDAGFTGTDQFQYLMRDASNNLSDPVTVTIHVIEGNRSPVGVQDVYGVVENTSLVLAAPGFLSNDYDPDGDALTAIVITDNVDNGSLTAFPSGNFTYTPDQDFTGTDQFVYQMRDAFNNLSGDITVTIEVIGSGTLPVGFDDYFFTSNDQVLNLPAPGFLANDVDQDGEALTATVILDNVDNGSLTAFPSGNFTYTPDPGFVGTDQFVYQMRDASNNLSGPVTVTIEVAPAANRAPVGTNDLYSAMADMTLTVASPGFLSNDVDPDGEAITAIVILDNVDNGSLTAFPNGNFSYTPDPGFTGTDQFQYQMRDASNNLSGPVTVTIEVYPGNRAPIGVDDQFAVIKNTPLSIPTSGFLTNDFDPDGEALTATVILDNVDSGNLVAFPDGNFTYTPNTDFTGTDQFIYQMRDASNNLSGPITVTLNVVGPNESPVAVADNVTTECQGPAGTTVILDGSDSYDPEEGPLTYSWYENGSLIAGPTSSPTAEVVLTTGDYLITLTVEDDCGHTDSDVADVSVVDTTDPTVIAAFSPTANSKEYMISCTAEDVCSENITTSSIIKIPVLVSPSVVLKSSSKYSIEIDPAKNEVSVNAPNPGAFWTIISSQGGVSVDDGQILGAKYDKKKYKYEFDDFGNLASVSGDVIVLLCTANDGNTNIGSAEATLPMSPLAALASQANSSGLSGEFGEESVRNYPNPFNERTTIQYQIEEAGDVQVTVYDQSGRQLEVLFEGPQQPGAHEVTWIADTYKQGMYFYQIRQNNQFIRGKMMLVKGQ